MKRFPWHTILLCLYLTLFLFSQNIRFLDWNELWTPLVKALGMAIGILALLIAVFRDKQKAGVLASLLVLLGLSYGFYRDAWYGNHLLGIRIDHNFYRWSSLIIALLLAWRLWKRQDGLMQWTRILNFITLVLVAMTLVPITSSLGSSNKKKGPETTAAVTDAPLPPIYLFIMDAYGREDVLRELYDHDNSSFMDALRDRGFYVADSSFSNYNKTVLAIPSLLRMDYLGPIIEQEGVESTDQGPLLSAINDNATVDLLRGLGYETISMDGPVLKYLYMDQADHFTETPGSDINAFEHALINQSIYRAFVRKSDVSNQDGYAHHRKKILNAFEVVKDASLLKTPHFVHAHILSPHQPFIFDAEGRDVEPTHEYTCWYPVEDGRDPEAYRREYIEQLKFINIKLLETIDHVLAHAYAPPIILIQGDHGPCAELTNTKAIEGNNFHERMPILNAYHFPGSDTTGLYPGISPVNSFRLIFSNYFDQKMEMLPDRSYYSTWDKVYDMVDVTESVN